VALVERIDGIVARALAADFPDIRRLLVADGLPVDDVTEDLLQHFRVFRSDDGVVVGCIGMQSHGEAGLLRSLAVAAAFRQQGIGRRLVEAIEVSAREQDVQALFLLTSTAAEYFERRGYRRIPRTEAPLSIQGTREFRDLCPASAVLMVKSARA
jgi:amino-acid N-acetyltransferase